MSYREKCVRLIEGRLYLSWCLYSVSTQHRTQTEQLCNTHNCCRCALLWRACTAGLAQVPWKGHCWPPLVSSLPRSALFRIRRSSATTLMPLAPAASSSTALSSCAALTACYMRVFFGVCWPLVVVRPTACTICSDGNPLAACYTWLSMELARSQIMQRMCYERKPYSVCVTKTGEQEGPRSFGVCKFYRVTT